MSHRSLVAALILVAIVMVAGVVHIASLLLLPRVAPEDAYARLAVFAAGDGLRVLPRAGLPGDPLPGRDPSVATAVCRYDLDRGPLRVSAAVDGRGFVALSLHSRSGIAFYGLDDRAENDGRLDFVLLTASQREAAQARDTAEGQTREVRVVAPEARGFILFDILPRLGSYAEAERGLASMRCSVERPV
ncbi:DUF1254 domain-containing protein [Lichenibacterium ramalinae]|uniref:DUF1254 domain-containing protein n=1 Tax=Lichenibacterium ramalinae TaxID=2316527 RepID=A0A4Q2RF28_9HYPH|nr:hypothetical protein [Lichenibacterium ramalinae]RYB04936.1 hypothetical protein D3272_10690 [Lichenibacterium ramalinae]